MLSENNILGLSLREKVLIVDNKTSFKILRLLNVGFDGGDITSENLSQKASCEENSSKKSNY